MEKNPRNVLPDDEEPLEIVKAMRKRHTPPGHYAVKIESFSELSKMVAECGGKGRYDSCDFEAGGYKWRLSIYPNGNTDMDGDDHISLYLEIVRTDSLPHGWEVNAMINFLVFDQIRDKYLVVQDGMVRRYHAYKTEWGNSQLIPLSTFKNPRNGFLVNERCVFGAEVFVITSACKSETFSIMKQPLPDDTYELKIENFTYLAQEDDLLSESFMIGEHRWRFMIHPNGRGKYRGKYLSLQLLPDLDDTSFGQGSKLYVDFSLTVKDQLHMKHIARSASYWFHNSLEGYSFPNFMELSLLNDKSRGYIVKDTLTLEAQITRMSLTKVDGSTNMGNNHSNDSTDTESEVECRDEEEDDDEDEDYNEDVDKDDV